MSCGLLSYFLPGLVVAGFYAGLYGGGYGGVLIAGAPCAAIAAGTGCIVYFGMKATGKAASASDSALVAAKKAYKRAKFASSRAKVVARDWCIRKGTIPFDCFLSIALQQSPGVIIATLAWPEPVSALWGGSLVPWLNADLRIARELTAVRLEVNDGKPLPSPVQSADLMESQCSLRCTNS